MERKVNLYIYTENTDIYVFLGLEIRIDSKIVTFNKNKFPSILIQNINRKS